MTEKPVKSKTATGEIKEVEVFFPDELKKGVYSNNVFISHTTEEFILDFLAVAPPAGSVVARVFVGPAHMKRIINALTDNLAKYEETFGKISAEIKIKS